MRDIVPVTIAYGDGIGPEIMEAVIYVLKEAAVPIRLETIEIGESLYKKCYTYGISEDAWSQIFRTKALLKGPVTIPQGLEYKSLNITLKKNLELYANVKSYVSYLVNTADVVIIRENKLYADIEYQHTADTYESIELISRSNSEKIIRFAFEYALKYNRKKISCFNNAIKFTDKIFHSIFNEIASQYHDIKVDYISNLTGSLNKFDIIISNLYDDIISDIAVEKVSKCIASSADIGKDYAVFEAMHGSAPSISGQDIANPSGLLNATIMMLVHLGLTKYASKIENALKKTIEDGIHTADIYNPNVSSKKVGTKEFVQAIVQNLRHIPEKLKVAKYHSFNVDHNNFKTAIKSIQQKKLLGVDIFFDSHDIVDYRQITKQLTEKISSLSSLHSMHLVAILAKGLKLWPNSNVKEMFSDHWCCRFMIQTDIDTNTKTKLTTQNILNLLNDLVATINNSKDNKLEFIKAENLYLFNSTAGFSVAK
ncbi:isocitrate/isopropylmalate dehydrogenase family protein [Orientia chuto str. Dubai]|uniref:Isocitrate dehydrogenase [NADP] n=1 Tax=Orientia chuto str. Dubai TaxID=1359168 RepID=A0A0F3MJN0_9RICK|nr:NADP-dependent isocitrate dehydrogenase [Candidatus Orientia mediorientalis]KJV55856.1 isocitrate/isopropylmalate dehydrogenase family protein [Orientia chuto str. Dubai]